MSLSAVTQLGSSMAVVCPILGENSVFSTACVGEDEFLGRWKVALTQYGEKLAVKCSYEPIPGHRSISYLSPSYNALAYNTVYEWTRSEFH